MIVAERAAIGEWKFQRRDGTAIWCSYHGKAIDAGDMSKGSVWVYQDITARKEAEQALVQRTDDLQESLLQLHATQAQLIQTEKLVSLSRLVAGVAHELNTPVGNILTMTSSLSDRLTKLVDDESAGRLTRSSLHRTITECKSAGDLIVRNTQRVSQLIAQFKLVATDQSFDQRRHFRLGEYVSEVMAILASTLKSDQIEVAVEVESEIEMNSFPSLLAQVLTGLTDNARDHAFGANGGGRVTVRVRSLTPQRAEIVFADNGQGIPPESLSHVLDPFYTTRRGTGHAGLGLHILYNTVTATLGGTVSIDSVVGQGTTVTLTLPCTVEVEPKVV